MSIKVLEKDDSMSSSMEEFITEAIINSKLSYNRQNLVLVGVCEAKYFDTTSLLVTRTKKTQLNRLSYQ